MWLDERATKAAGSIEANTLFLDWIKIVLRNQLALFTLAFLCLRLSFAQVETSVVLLFRDCLGFVPLGQAGGLTLAGPRTS